MFNVLRICVNEITCFLGFHVDHLTRHDVRFPSVNPQCQTNPFLRHACPSMSQLDESRHAPVRTLAMGVEVALRGRYQSDTPLNAVATSQQGFVNTIRYLNFNFHNFELNFAREVSEIRWPSIREKLHPLQLRLKKPPCRPPRGTR